MPGAKDNRDRASLLVLQLAEILDEHIQTPPEFFVVRASRDHVGHGVGPAGSVEIAASGYGVAHVPAYAVDAASLMRLPDQSLLEAELDTVEILLPAQTSDVPSVNGRVRPGHALDVRSAFLDGPADAVRGGVLVPEEQLRFGQLTEVVEQSLSFPRGFRVYCAYCYSFGPRRRQEGKRTQNRHRRIAYDRHCSLKAKYHFVRK